MKTGISIIFVFLLAATLSAAQETAGEPSPPQNNIADGVQGVFINPAEGAPFSATVEIKNETLYPDGRVVTTESINEIARDRAGRIHNEIRRVMTDGSKGTPDLLEVHIFDPKTRLNTYYDTRTRLASQRVLSRPPTDLNARILAGHKPQSSDLGETLLNGMKCRGTLETYIIPASVTSSHKPVTVNDEFWFSEDLQIDILTHQSLSLGGGQTVAVLRIKREPPDPALFEVPDGYKIVDVTPPKSILVRQTQPKVMAR